MARISCTAGYHRTLATACVLQAVLSASLLHCDVRTGSEIVISFIFHCLVFRLLAAMPSASCRASAKTGSAMPAPSGGGLRQVSKTMRSSLGRSSCLTASADAMRRVKGNCPLPKCKRSYKKDLHCICQEIWGTMASWLIRHVVF